MTCPQAPEIKAKLLSPAYSKFLQSYIDRWKVDPSFLIYHHASTVLALRRQFDDAPAGNCCGKCDYDSLQTCDMSEVLRVAMTERIIEQETENAE